MPFQWIHLLDITKHKCTTLLFPFPGSLLLCSEPVPNLTMVATTFLVSWPWGGDWHFSYKAVRPEARAFWYPCHDVSLKFVEADTCTLQTFLLFTYTLFSLWWSLVVPSSFFHGGSFIYIFICRIEKLKLWRPGHVSCLSITKPSVMSPTAFSSVSQTGVLHRPLSPVKLTSV